MPSSVDIAEITRKGGAIYERIKSQYEPIHNGKHLAIDPRSGDVFMAEDPVDAVAAGRNSHPDVIFYLVKIGYRAVATLSSLYEYV